MSKSLFWKLCLFIASSVVTLFYLISLFTSQTEKGMSHLAVEDQQTLISWGKQAEQLYFANDTDGLNQFLESLQQQEKSWFSVVGFQIDHKAGGPIKGNYDTDYNLGRSVEWMIHLYFAENPVMEIPFAKGDTSLLVRLPDRMRPGIYWNQAEFLLQFIVPALFMALLSWVLYRHIMKPLTQLKHATKHFSRGHFDVSAKYLMGKRNDEFSDLATTFDQMASRIGEQIISQRQLIADLSHELRTPLTRLDIALAALKQHRDEQNNITRIDAESQQIRKLVEDSLNLAWLENEQPELKQESLDLIDLLDVLIEDATFEFPDHKIQARLPDSAIINHSSHRAAGQALENILRNALRYTPAGKTVAVVLDETQDCYQIKVIDQGPGVEEQFLESIFKPFYRLDQSRVTDGFGLGLSLAKRQLATIRASVVASNNKDCGLCMTITLPKN